METKSKNYLQIVIDLQELALRFNNAELAEQTKILAELEAAEMTKIEKESRMFGFYQALLSTREYIDSQIDNMKRALEIAENKIEAFKDYVGSGIQLNGKISHPLFSAYIKSTQSTIIDDETVIPKQFIKEKIVTSIDKKALKESIESGDVVPGAHLQNNQSIIIMPKKSKSLEVGNE